MERVKKKQLQILKSKKMKTIQTELKNLKSISYYENEISIAFEKIKATNNFLSEATNETQIEFGNQMNKLYSESIYHCREIILHIRSVKKLMNQLSN